ncbi:beta-1,3-galactosyltransferase 4 [Carettochelys insculpta]|uniref:beta-1,3-galactosyltransferase 4 n=1 Tax=Carettochelys insculpta TaxID=44489 RepID=UPI003EBEAE8B
MGATVPNVGERHFRPPKTAPGAVPCALSPRGPAPGAVPLPLPLPRPRAPYLSRAFNPGESVGPGSPCRPLPQPLISRLRCQSGRAGTARPGGVDPSSPTRFASAPWDSPVTGNRAATPGAPPRAGLAAAAGPSPNPRAGCAPQTAPSGGLRLPRADTLTPMVPRLCLPRRPPVLLLRGLLVGLVLVSLLLGGTGEELLAWALAPFLGSRRQALHTAPLLPGPDAFLLPNVDACGPRAPFLLVMVASAPGHVAQRQVVRGTWGGARWAGGRPVRTLFALGVPSSGEEQAQLEQEAQRHGDLVQGRFVDTYANLTLKTTMLLGWAAAHCPGATFVAKADDDVFLNLPALVRHLGELPSPHWLYLGRVHWWAWPVRDSSHRHYVSFAAYSAGNFPLYCSGTTYVLSQDAVLGVLGAAPHVPHVPPEDVYVGLCARWAGLAPTHSARMAGSTHYPWDPCCYGEGMYSVHQVGPQVMKAAWATVERERRACTWLQRALGLLRCKGLALCEELWGGWEPGRLGSTPV